jgi:hypothetical protein
MKILRAGFLTALALTACTACSSSVDVQNKSTTQVRNLTVSVGGNDLQVKELNPGERAVVRYKPRTDSSVAVTFQTSDDPVIKSCEGNFYVTDPSTDHFVVTVTEDKRCLVLRKRE